MKKRVRKKSADDDPVCICGYPRIGLPAIDSPCPECGSIVLAAYKGSFSYHGWNAALLGAGISIVHLLGVMVALLLDEYALNIFFNEYALGILFVFGWFIDCLSLLFTVMSIFMREKKRRSLRNVILAGASLVLPSILMEVPNLVLSL